MNKSRWGRQVKEGAVKDRAGKETWGSTFRGYGEWSERESGSMRRRLPVECLLFLYLKEPVRPLLEKGKSQANKSIVIYSIALVFTFVITRLVDSHPFNFCIFHIWTERVCWVNQGERWVGLGWVEWGRAPVGLGPGRVGSFSMQVNPLQG